MTPDADGMYRMTVITGYMRMHTRCRIAGDGAILHEVRSDVHANDGSLVERGDWECTSRMVWE